MQIATCLVEFAHLLRVGVLYDKINTLDNIEGAINIDNIIVLIYIKL